MAQDPMRKYSDALDDSKKAREQVKRLEGIVGMMLIGLREPYRLMISDVDAQFPPEVGLSKNVNHFNGKDWPQIQQIANALANLHKKRRIVEQVWNDLSDADKQAVNPLPEKK